MEKQTNERLVKSQKSMNEFDRKIQLRHKGTTSLGFTKEWKSPWQGAQNNKRFTCTHCEKLGHTSKKC